MDDFKRALQFVLWWEGGFVHHPADLGGPTNKGITQATYDAWRKARGQSPRPVREIEEKEVEQIYYDSYWLPWCPDLRWPFCLVAFDSFVQFGVRGTALLWQPLAGVQVDGIWGRITQGRTLDLIQRKGPRWCALQLALARVRYRATRVGQNWSQRVFLAGWLGRDCNLIEEIYRDLA